MQPVEAMTILISEADYRLAAFKQAWSETRGEEPIDLENLDWVTRTELAVAVAQAMLNTAIPVARFRCHVTIERVTEKAAIIGLCDFTVCSVNIDGIKAGIFGLARQGLVVSAHLFEQRATGADMLSGYQGPTKTLQYRNWLKQIDQFEISPTVQ